VVGRAPTIPLEVGGGPTRWHKEEAAVLGRLREGEGGEGRVGLARSGAGRHGRKMGRMAWAREARPS
jgi:hypothetical protein